MRLKSCLFPLVTKVFIIQFILMVFLKTKCWLQHEVTVNLDSTGIRRERWENFLPHSGEKFGLTCIVQRSSASAEGSEPRESSHPVGSAFSSCLKVGGWMCVPVFETAGSQNPLQGTTAKLTTVGMLVVSPEESPLVSNPKKQAAVRSLFPTWIMADLLKHRAPKWQGASSSSWVMTKLCFFFFFTQSMLKANLYHHNPFILITSCKTASVKIGQRGKRMIRKGILSLMLCGKIL